MKKLKFLLSTVFCILASFAFSQSDTIKFKGGDIIAGTIKEMTHGILTMETDYSDSDFKIEWEKVVEVISSEKYTIALRDKTMLTYARISTISPAQLEITSPDGNRQVTIEDVVYLREVDGTFWDKASASLDIGFSLTKANNLRQYNARAGLGYKTDKWILDANYSQVVSEQDDVAATERTDATIGADYLLKHSFFVGASVNFLSNTEQLLDLRSSGQVGLGYFMIRSLDMYWSTFLGTAFNNENYGANPDSPAVSKDRSSYEAVVGTELNLFDVGDLDLFTNVYWYPSFTETGRHRADFRLDIKYDLPLDFYVKAGITYNYDNKPVEGASEYDYVMQTGFGWEL